VYWRVVAVMDFGLAGFNAFLAWWMWNLVSLMNLLAAVVCAALGAFCLRRDARQRASLAEDARIKHIQDNWPWI